MAAVNSASTVHIEKLKGVENYNTWKFVMKMVLIHEDLWDLVDNDVDSTKPEDVKRGQKALARIALSVQPTAFSHIRNASSAHAAWVNLQNAYEDKGLCRRLGLLRTLFSTKLQDCGDMQKYINKIMDLAQQLSDIGAGLDDDFIAVLMLSGLSEDYDPLIMAMENSNIKLSSEIVSAKLLQERLRRDDKNENVTALAAVKKAPKCFGCKKTGHFLKNCPTKQASKKKMPADTSKALLTALSVNLESDSWYVDSGATSHMCKERHMLEDFVEDKLRVTVANGETLTTAGYGTAKVYLKNGITRTISNVHYVPKLTVNLLSVSSMVSKGFDVVFSSSTCQIKDKGVVVASAHLKMVLMSLTLSRLYHLSVKLVHRIQKSSICRTRRTSVHRIQCSQLLSMRRFRMRFVHNRYGTDDWDTSTNAAWSY